MVTFEERSEAPVANARSIGQDLDGLIRRKRLAIEHVGVERSEIEETGEDDLEGLFIRLDQALNSVKAKRIVLDTIESLFAGLDDAGILRAELRRLFAWLKDRGITAVITGERGQNTLTRQGLEEYVSRLRDRSRSSGRGPDFDPAPARCEGPGGVRAWGRMITLF